MEKATLGGGCFWCLEPVFAELTGVIAVDVGYAGGKVPNPPYQLVCTGLTGHAEVVQVTFDSQVISYRELLEVFFSIHDPTTLNRQGNDSGPQYRSVIFYHSPEQQATAAALIQELEAQKIWKAAIVTELAPYTNYYRAEEYHQEYFKKNPYQGYCQVIIAPKLAKFRKQYAARLR
jgi:peptide-methionine (S)-S-oxide reductase